MSQDCQVYLCLSVNLKYILFSFVYFIFIKKKKIKKKVCVCVYIYIYENYNFNKILPIELIKTYYKFQINLG